MAYMAGIFKGSKPKLGKKRRYEPSFLPGGTKRAKLGVNCNDDRNLSFFEGEVPLQRKGVLLKETKVLLKKNHLSLRIIELQCEKR